MEEVIPFPVLEIKFYVPGINETHLVQQVFDQRPGTRNISKNEVFGYRPWKAEK